MKTKIIIVSTIALLAAALTGCRTPVPSNHISGSLGGVPFELENHKQTTMQGFLLSVTTGTNTCSLSISNLVSTNDPQVIDKSYAGQAAVTKEFFTGMNEFASKLVEGGVKGAK
jgi:hypothetical protein